MACRTCEPVPLPCTDGMPTAAPEKLHQEKKLYFSKKIGYKLTSLFSAADVKMEILDLIWSLKSRFLSSNSFQMGKTFRGVASVAVEQ